MKKTPTPITITIIIPSAPDRSFEAILENLKKIKPDDVSFEIFIIKGTWPPSQRNMGIKEATGKYIFFFDDDIIIPKGSLEKAISTFESNSKIQVVGGPNLTPIESTFIQKCIGQAHASFFTGMHTAVRYYPEKNLKQVNENHLITCNLGFRTKILKENMFNPKLYANEENELLGRIIRKNNLLAYNPEFFVYHHRRKAIKDYCKQIFAWGEGRTLHTLKQPAHFSPTFFVPAFFVFYLTSFIWWNPPEYFIPLALYFLLDLGFSAYACWKEKKLKYIFILPWLFILTHITYGLGTIWGLLSVFKERTTPEEKEFLLIKVDMT